MQPCALIIDEDLVFLNGLKKLFMENKRNHQIYYSTTLSSLKESLLEFSPEKIIVDIKLIERAPKEITSLLFNQTEKLILLTTFENDTYPHLQKKYGDIPIYCKTTSITQLINSLKP